MKDWSISGLFSFDFSKESKFVSRNICGARLCSGEIRLPQHGSLRVGGIARTDGWMLLYIVRI